MNRKLEDNNIELIVSSLTHFSRLGIGYLKTHKILYLFSLL